MKAVEIILMVFGGLGGIIIVYDWIIKKFFSKRLLLNKIKKLAPATTIEYFISILGGATFVNTKDTHKEYVFVHKLAYIVAFTNSSNRVLLFSVTTRDSRFNPNFILGPYLLGAKAIKIKIGKTNFHKIDKIGFSSGQVFSGCGNRRGYYIEEYYFGNPGNYQTYIFSINQAGYTSNFDGPILNLGAKQSDDPRIQEFRRNAVINTFSITAPHTSISDIEEGLEPGPDYDQVRILNQ